MAKSHLKNRIDDDVLRMADEIATKLSKDAGVPVSQGSVVERAVKELHEKVIGKSGKKGKL